MPSVEVSFKSTGFNELSKRIRGILDRVQNTQPAMEVASEYMQKSIRHRIAVSKKSPDGDRWEPLADETVETKKRKGRSNPSSILVDTGELKDSIEEAFVDKSDFIVEAGAEHASYPQYGTSDQPARPFMGFSPENIKRITSIINTYVMTGDLKYSRRG
jgi:phage gpG-like protein